MSIAALFRRPPARRARILSLPLLAALSLGGCYTVDQPRLNAFANETVTPGMALDHALVRMSVEGFNCQKDGASSAYKCTRDQRTALRAVCVERVDLKTGGGKTVTAVLAPPVECGKFL